MKAKRDILGVANKGDELTKVEDYNFTLGNDSDVVVVNRNNGMSIISIEDIEFDENETIRKEPETEKEQDEDVVQDDLKEDDEF